MSLTRRSFLTSAAAFSLFGERLAAAVQGTDLFETPDGRAADFLVCRRLYLDVCGRLPTMSETEAYVASSDSEKLPALVDRLLASESFADYWSMRYCDILRVKSEFPINLWPNAVYVYHRRIRAAVAADEPWDAFARALLRGCGSNFRVPEANFFRAVARRTPEGLSEAASTTFLLEPSEEFAPYFSHIAWKSTREWKEEIVYRTDGPDDETPEAFAERLTDGDLRERFIAAQVSRFHWWLFGTLPPEDRRDAWAELFEAAGLRLKPFLRQVLVSPEYLAGPIRGGFPARRLDAEVLDDAICDLTGAERSFVSIAPEPFTYLPKARRSVLVEDGSISSPFLLLFGRPARDTGLLAERSNAITAKQRLYLYNSGKLAGSFAQMLGAPRFKALPRPEKIRELYLRFLSRPSTAAESGLIEENKLWPRDIAWLLLNSREFLYRI